MLVGELQRSIKKMRKKNVSSESIDNFTKRLFRLSELNEAILSSIKRFHFMENLTEILMKKKHQPCSLKRKKVVIKVLIPSCNLDPPDILIIPFLFRKILIGFP